MSDTARCPFIIGQKVTPRDKVICKEALAEGIRDGGVYTISDIYVYECANRGPLVMLIFEGVRRLPTLTRPPRGGWAASSFHPITDISNLTALLNTAPNRKQELV